MAIKNLPRLIAVSTAAVVLAVALGAQAVSSVSTRKQPALAVTTFPANGLAREALAFQNFSVAVAEQTDPTAAARQNVAEALLAIKSDPLAPKAIVVIALGEEDEGLQADILEAASKINRRDLNLQSQILRKHLAAQDYDRSINTLDQILRVHPEYSPEFFPVLGEALDQPETIPLFAEILDGSAAWHERFLNYTVRQRVALPSLAALRPLITSATVDFDKRLIAGLTGQGDSERAAAIYRLASGNEGRADLNEPLGWASEYPPFEWQFIDEAGFRAQPSRDGDELELFVRPGKGGLIAGRLLQAPDGPFAIRIEHDIKPIHQREDASLALTCTNGSAPVLTQTLEQPTDTFQVQALPQDCDYMVLAINARAWTGRSALRGSIKQISVVPGASTGN